MTALLSNQKHIIDTLERIPKGHFRVSERDTNDQDEISLRDFGTYEEALLFAAKRQAESKQTLLVHRIWNDSHNVLTTMTR